MNTEVTTLPPPETALAVFSAPKGLEPYLLKIRSEIDSFVPCVDTAKGRQEIASIAHSVARSKTALDNIGKELVAELKDVPKKIDAERKRMRDTLDQWKEEVRKPLTEWEEGEARRVANHTAAVDWFKLRAEENDTLCVEELRRTIAEVERREPNESWEEFEVEGHRYKRRALESLNAQLVKRQEYEDEQLELALLRAKAEEQAQKDREELIARQAAEQAKADAALEAQREKDAADRREREMGERLAQAERDRLEAVRRSAEAAQRAVDAEKQRAKQEADRVAAEQAKRESDRAHMAPINRAAMQALIDHGIPAEYARRAITLIAWRVIPGVSMNY